MQEADDRALLEAAADDWRRLSMNAGAVTSYKAESSELESFDPSLPAY